MINNIIHPIKEQIVDLGVPASPLHFPLQFLPFMTLLQLIDTTMNNIQNEF